ncbi:MAG: amidohydrolase family protein [Methylobacteriaceae bacterium]|nr:amidohydrolase family protein [Methylobacteriaceae bacterium]MBV9246609.1 amidohydrolase family protein [Methylobacteriaceae bacterium]MBV9635446.1 amidohydrolase family protein [Methylobacteriaceae bacterium]MBV9703194.1 amidohydrolase family protein [Methylobacteriaceae bacterium]
MAAILLKNVMVWDGDSDALHAGEVLVERNRIKSVARGTGQIARDRAAEVIDGGGMTLMPGLVEGHCHLSFVGPARNQDLGEIPPEEHLLRTCRNATLILDHGFTSCYSAASAKLRLDVVVRQEIEDGYLAGPRYRAAGPEITVTGGLGDERRQHMHAESFGMIADGPDEIRRAVRLCIREGVDNIKLNISGDEFVSHARAEVTSMTEIEVATAVEVAHEWGKRVACHSRAAESVKRGVRNGCDCIYHCDFADEEALDMLEAAKDRIIVGPAVGLVHNAVFESERAGMSKETVAKMGLPRKFEATCRTYEQIRKRGIKVVIGGDYGFTLTPMGQNARDIGHFVKFFGYTPAEALRCATQIGGELMGHKGELGLVKEGALADLLLVDGNPLADQSILVGPSHFAMIMKDGQLHRDPRHAAVPRQRVAAE